MSVKVVKIITEILGEEKYRAAIIASGDSDAMYVENILESDETADIDKMIEIIYGSEVKADWANPLTDYRIEI